MLWLVLPPAVLLAALAALWVVGERGHLVLPSTRAALRGRDGTKHGGLVTALHGYVYGRWTVQYIRTARRSLPWMTRGMKRWWADRYHGKVLPTDLARRVITLDHEIRRTDLERIVPYPMAREILLSSPPSVTLFDCPCRRGRPNPCRPTEVCMLVGGGDFVLDHHPGRARRVSTEEALALLDAEHERGHVHTAYFKDACDHRFYAICNCCKCCCGGLEAMVKYGVPMVASSGYVAQVDEATCIGCGDCEPACPFEAIIVPYRAEVIWEKCMGCGVCTGQCPTDAVTLVLDARKGVPLDVRTIGRPAATCGTAST